MYEFHEYFDLEKSETPYNAAGEELEDYLRLLDMMLESYLEFKTMKSRKNLFSRGLVITEAEMTDYFEMPPYFRERDIWDPVLSAKADSAFEYISGRASATYSAGASDDEAVPLTDLIRIEHLKNAFDLSRTEVLAVLLALTAEIDRRYERIFGFLQDDITKKTPTIGLLYALMGRITPRNGSEETIPVPLDSRMYTYFLIRKDGQNGLDAPLILNPLAKKILMGTAEQKEKNAEAFRMITEEEGIPLFFNDSYEELEFIMSREILTGEAEKEARDSAIDNALYLENEDGETILHLLYQYCTAHGEKLYILDESQLADMQADKRQLCLSELFLRLKMYKGRLAIHYIAEESFDMAPMGRSGIVSLLDTVRTACGPDYVFVFGEKEEPGELAAMLVPCLHIPDTPVTLRTDMWNHFLSTDSSIRIADDVKVADMADCYEIPYGKIRKVIGHTIANARMKPDPVIDRKLILESLRQMNQVDFSGLATYVNPVYTWDDITITPTQREIMHTACNRYRLRNRIGEGWGLKRRSAYGNGVSILLYGPPGTGKTMAAQVIANELALPLYRVDISQIASKYIGETEKNLSVIFAAAQKANVILFFDEADSLFSKRTDVGDSHDKYANNETSYLLQKIEDYNGMSILATNYYNNFDNAFVRRITYAIHMESPDKDTRYALWTSILPKAAKMDKNIDYRFLADKFELSGSNIKAILYNAAYMAGAEETAVGMKHIIRSMEYEFTKLGKLVNAGDFGDYEIYLQSWDPKKKPPSKRGRKTTGKSLR